MIRRILKAAVMASLATLLVALVAAAPASAAFCHYFTYTEPGHRNYDDVFNIEVHWISCHQAKRVLTYPRWGDHGPNSPGARGLHGFRHYGFQCSARRPYPDNKSYIGFHCRNGRKVIRFRWHSVP
jgi:hypothetical protein